MAVPTFAKTWQFNVNQNIVATGVLSNTCRNALFAIKQALVGFASNAWTVVNSTNGTGSAPIGTDTWLTTSNIIGAGAGTNHSWIVLKQAGISANFEILIDCINASLVDITFVVSPVAGFTGGSATNRPTATDEIVFITNNAWGGAISTDNNIIVNVMQSTDGQCTRIITCSQSLAVGFWFFDAPQNPVSGWSNPSVSYAAGSNSPGSQAPTLASILSALAAPLRGRSGTGTFNMWMGIEGQFANAESNALTSTNDFDGTLPFFVIGVASTTAGARGRHANLFDMYMNQVSPGLTGDVFPIAHPWTWALFGNVIVPWNDTTPTIA